MEWPLDTPAVCTSLAFITRCSVSGLPAYLACWPAKNPVHSLSPRLPLPPSEWEPLATSCSVPDCQL